MNNPRITMSIRLYVDGQRAKSEKWAAVEKKINADFQNGADAIALRYECRKQYPKNKIEFKIVKTTELSKE